jgi:hypothetical protein
MIYDLEKFECTEHRWLAMREIRAALQREAAPGSFTDRDVAEAQRLLGIAGALQEEVDMRRQFGGD